MKLTTRTRYGTRMVLDIAQNDHEGPVHIEDVAKRQDISVKYLEKLANKLKTAGYIKSRRGPHGGHMLAKKPEEITLGQIVRVLEGSPLVVDCEAEQKNCPHREECLTKKAWEDVTRTVYERLDSYTLADLLEDAVRTNCEPCREAGSMIPKTYKESA